MPAVASSHPAPNGVVSSLKHALMPSGPRATPKPKGSAVIVDILDIRQTTVEASLKAEIVSSFFPKDGPRTLPTLLLYNERGLQLFEHITYLDEYYLTNDEIDLLKKSSADIASKIPSGAMLVELGSGNLRKINLLLQALDAASKKVDYYALDLSQKELERTLAQLPAYENVRCCGLLGTFEDGREWLKSPPNVLRQKCIVYMGSSIGNFSRDEAPDVLGTFAHILNYGDTMLVGVDSCQDPGKIYHAYNDKEGLTHQFVLNGLTHANRVLGDAVFKENDWQVIGEYVYDEQGGRHQAFYKPRNDTLVMGELIKSHERIQVEQSLKYSRAEADRLWKAAGLVAASSWTKGDEYGLHLLSKPRMSFSRIPSVYAQSPLPTLEDWEALWAAWDVVTLKMLPNEELLSKPIKLRNACIFYLGHIPTFLDIQLNKTTKESPTEPAWFSQIFERGIDPDVDNPEMCHSHSEIPDEWPPVDQILTYQGRVRSRVRKMYERGREIGPRNVARAVWMGFEHELMHIETLLYMMLQSDKTLPPPDTETPDFEKLAAKARSARVDNEWFDIPEQTIAIGLDDPDDGTDLGVHFGWDNEKPRREEHVHAFQAKGRPMTNEEYALYMYDQHVTQVPASWAELDVDGKALVGRAANGHGVAHGTNGHSNGDHANGKARSAIPEGFLVGKAVRTVYGLVPLKHALDWPVCASYDELVGCAAWMGGRIPTFEEARSIYAHAETVKRAEAEKKLGKTVPAVNGHLSNNGVQETPPSPTSQAGDEEQELFVDLDGADANVGFRRWHPAAVTGRGGELAGQAGLGGAWEWTSSALAAHRGFAPMAAYPGYSADFFDGKHNVVLGGSWATHPRIAGRKSFINWYQRNYLYAWCGARLVRDVDIDAAARTTTA